MTDEKQNETLSPELAYRIIGLCMAGYFGRGKRGIEKAAKLHKAGILGYWAQSATAALVFKPATVVEVG